MDGRYIIYGIDQGEEKVCCTLCSGKIIRTNEAIRLTTRGVKLCLRGVERNRCTECGEEFFNPAEAAKFDYECRKQYRAATSLTGGHVVRIRRKLKISQADLEKALGLGSKVIVRWEKGKVRIPQVANALLRILDKHPELLGLVDGRTVT